MGTNFACRRSARFDRFDLSTGMLTAAAQPATVCGEAERLPFRDGVFDVVTATLSLCHWTDVRAGLTEVGRVTADGATLVLVTVSALDDRRHCAGGLPPLTRADFDAAGLVVSRAGIIAGYGPVPSLTRIVARPAPRRGVHRAKSTVAWLARRP